MSRTPAEEQIEALKRLKAEKMAVKPRLSAKAPKAVSAATPTPSPAKAPLVRTPPLIARQEAPPPGRITFELAENPAPKGPKPEEKALPLSPETWKRLRARQARTKEFKRRRDMGEWAAALLLAMPPRAHLLSPEGKADLFARMQEWGRARGLK